MARLSNETWEQLKADYITGVYTLQQLGKKYGTSHAAISKRSKKEDWNKLDIKETADLVEKNKVTKSYKDKVTKVTKENNISENTLNHAVDEIVDYQKKINDIQSLALDKAKSLLDGGVAQKVVIESMGEAGSSATAFEYDLQADDIKKIVEAIDKASLTFGVNPRFASGVNIQNNNEQTNNTLKVEWID